MAEDYYYMFAIISRNNINAVLLKSYVFPDNIEAFLIEILSSCKCLVNMLLM